MIKNAILSIKKNVGKTILLLVLMCVIANLVIAGLSIKNATSKSMEQVVRRTRTSSIARGAMIGAWFGRIPISPATVLATTMVAL